MEVFVSYAHADDLRAEGAPSGWVQAFIHHLDTYLKQRVQASGGELLGVWSDERLSPADPFPEQLRNAAAGAATLVAVLSPRYCASQWCSEELAAFRSSLEQRYAPDGPVFIVEILPVAPERRPTELRELLSLEFWWIPPGQSSAVPLGWPYPRADNVNHEPFFWSVADLAERIVRRLETAPAATEPLSPEPPPAPDGGNDAKVLVSAAPSEADTAQAVRTILEMRGYQSYSAQPDAPAGDVRARLHGALHNDRALVYLLSQESQEWLRSQIRQVNKIIRSRDRALEFLGIVSDLPLGEIPQVAGALDLLRDESAVWYRPVGDLASAPLTAEHWPT